MSGTPRVLTLGRWLVLLDRAGGAPVRGELLALLAARGKERLAADLRACEGHGWRDNLAVLAGGTQCARFAMASHRAALSTAPISRPAPPPPPARRPPRR